jgi:UrcA family protein
MRTLFRAGLAAMMMAMATAPGVKAADSDSYTVIEGARRASPGFHEGDVEVRSARVSLKGLDLTSGPGKVMARRRLASAAQHVCGDTDIRNLHEVSQFEQCRGEALTTALVTFRRMLATAQDPNRYAYAIEVAPP